jgi:hypothetical protein
MLLGIRAEHATRKRHCAVNSGGQFTPPQALPRTSPSCRSWCASHNLICEERTPAGSPTVARVLGSAKGRKFDGAQLNI